MRRRHNECVGRAFGMRHRAIGRRHLVVVSGELTESSSLELRRLMRRVCTNEREIELDLGAVSFIDPAGLWTLMAIKALCEEHGGTLVVRSCRRGERSDGADALPPRPTSAARMR